MLPVCTGAGTGGTANDGTSSRLGMTSVVVATARFVTAPAPRGSLAPALRRIAAGVTPSLRLDDFTPLDRAKSSDARAWRAGCRVARQHQRQCDGAPHARRHGVLRAVARW